jgi:hypothetical protein
MPHRSTKEKGSRQLIFTSKNITVVWVAKLSIWYYSTPKYYVLPRTILSTNQAVNKIFVHPMQGHFRPIKRSGAGGFVTGKLLQRPIYRTFSRNRIQETSRSLLSIHPIRSCLQGTLRQMILLEGRLLEYSLMPGLRKNE